jgi:hypothetical protein
VIQQSARTRSSLPILPWTHPGFCQRCGHRTETRLGGMVKASEPGIEGVVRQCDPCSDRCDNYAGWYTIRAVAR